MTEYDHKLLRRLFDLAFAAPAGDRGALLEHECRGDAVLRKRIEAMIAAAEDERFLSSPTLDVGGAKDTEAATIDSSTPKPSSGTVVNAARASSVASGVREAPGARIGPYKLLQLIGEGGFGSVFMAEQEQPVMRKVALKIIKLGMDTRQVVARFEQERQALAMMDHPNIAKVFDAGSTETGRPYFVMELCKGEPIDEYCDRNILSIEERLELFAQVCIAVQHAHTKGIIHRDIKPSNILVSMQDGRHAAKVIDFGIAKATSSKLTEKTLFTEHKQLIGTPEYMSPEQAAGSLDIDTRTDLYSLGVLLYKLLTGSTPFSMSELRSAAYGEIQRIIREVDPPKPSTKLSQSEATIARIAAQRRTAPRKLGMIVRGELDWIVMKALEKDRQRRYETASGLAEDVRRYLAGEAVVAAPPGAAYRARKFLRRHRVMVTGGTAVGAALLLGAIAFAWQAQVARGQRDLALKAQAAEAEQRRAADEQRAMATEQRDRAMLAEAESSQRADEVGQVADFQAKMLSQIDPTEAGLDLLADIRGRFRAALEKAGIPEAERAAREESFRLELLSINSTDVASEMIDRTILSPALRAVDEQFKDQPALDAKLRSTLSELYRVLGQGEEAIRLQRRALEIRKAALGETHRDTLSSLNELGAMLHDVGKLDEAESYLKQAFEGRARLLGEDHPETLVSMGNLGNLYSTAGRFAEAEPMLRDHLDRQRRVRGNEHRETLIAINTLGYLFAIQGKLDQTDPLWREAYETGRRVLGEDHRDVLVWINNLAGLLQARGKMAEAEPLFRESMDKHRRVLGEEHPGTIRAIGAMASHYRRVGLYEQAEPLLREAFEKSTRVLGPEHPQTLDTTTTMGMFLMERGQLAEAEPHLTSTWEITSRTLGPEHPDTLSAAGVLAKLKNAQGRYAEAEAIYRESLEVSRRTLGDENTSTLITINNLGGVLMSLDKLDEAEPLIREVAATRARVSGPEHPETLIARSTLASLLERQQKPDEAEAIYRDVLSVIRRVRGQDHPDTLAIISNLAALLRSAGRPAEAEPLFREAATAAERKLGKDHRRTASYRRGLGETLMDLKQLADAEPELLEAHRAYSAAQGASNENRRRCAELLVALYSTWDAAEPGQGYDAKAADWKAKQQALESPKSLEPPAPSPQPTSAATQSPHNEKK